MDRGRPRTRSFGVPVGGAADQFALAVGNALVGNPPDTPALEITLHGPTLAADADLACVLFGAPFDLGAGPRRLDANKTFTLRAGKELTVHGTAEGMRAYFCVHGGLDGRTILGSRSSLEPLTAGDELPCIPGGIAPRFIAPRFAWNAAPRLLRHLPGPQADWFRDDEFAGRTFTVTPACDRMGTRLDGESLTVPDRELVSEPVCPGAVQVTRDGRCIVLGVDGQTIGGYPKIAQVISADLDKLAQLRPGDRLAFRRVSLEEAEYLYHRKQEELREWLLRLRAATS